MSGISYVTIRRMITITIKEAAEKRGITSSYQLQQKMESAGFKTYPTRVSKFWKNEMVTLPTLDIIAEALGCDISELYSWKPDKKSAKTAKR